MGWNATSLQHPELLTPQGMRGSFAEKAYPKLQQFVPAQFLPLPTQETEEMGVQSLGWLLSQVSSLRLPSGHSGPVLTLSNAARSSPFHPHLLVADAGIWVTFLLGVAFRHVICGFYLFFLPVRLPSEIRKLPPDPPARGFPGVWKLPPLRLSSRDRSPSPALLSLFLSFIFCPTSFQDNGLLFWVSDVLS